MERTNELDSGKRMDGTPRECVLTALDEWNIDLPDDGLTFEKVRERAYGFEFASGNELSFRIERHPTMYLSDMGVPGIEASPARFHVVREYRLDLEDETWSVEELTSAFEYESWLILEAELWTDGLEWTVKRGIDTVRDADDPEATFEDVFGSWIDHWDEKFDELEGRAVPDEDKEAILELLVGTLRERAGLD